jgi:hypothetical protein
MFAFGLQRGNRGSTCTYSRRVGRLSKIPGSTVSVPITAIAHTRLQARSIGRSSSSHFILCLLTRLRSFRCQLVHSCLLFHTLEDVKCSEKFPDTRRPYSRWQGPILLDLDLISIAVVPWALERTLVLQATETL